MKRGPTILIASLATLVLVAALALFHHSPPPRHPAAIGAPPSSAVAATENALGTDRAYVYAGPPRSTHSVDVLKNRAYVVGYSERRRNPLWVAYRAFRTNATTIGSRPSRFSADRRTQANVRHDDYTRSGYDRGHMAPNYAIATRYGRGAQLETFLMSNICPQKPTLNRYVWKKLEMLVAKDYANRFEEVWIICGPIFDEHIEKLTSGVEIPDAFYKIIVDEKDGKVRALAFIMPQDVGSGEKVLSKCLTSVNDVERQTKLDFLHELPDQVENEVEAHVPRALW